jgi:metallo-beta-lactamase class B
MLCPRVENANAGKIAAPPNVRNNSIINAAPKKAFDDLFFLGEYTAWESSASAWGIDTGEGIVLIDTLYADSVGVIETGLRQLGKDPNDIKYIVIGHGHADHYGGARYLQDKYNARVMMSELEYAFMYANSASEDTKPKQDMVITDGQVFTLGNTTFNFYVTPGHTPGTVSTIFNAHEGSTEHMVAQWGGTGFGFNGATGQDQIDWFLTYADSAARFKGLIQEMEADVLIANHPILDNSIEKLAALGSEATNPWVVGVETVANYTDVAGSCALAGAAAFAA